MGLGRVACGSASHIEGGGPSRYVIALGYDGWGQGQLEEEMTRHGWFVAPVSDQLLFGTSAQDRWSAAWSANGIDSSLLASPSGHACQSSSEEHTSELQSIMRTSYAVFSLKHNK